MDVVLLRSKHLDKENYYLIIQSLQKFENNRDSTSIKTNRSLMVELNFDLFLLML